jgi:uncharacterized protein
LNYRVEDIPPEGLLVRGERGGDWLKNLFQGQGALEFTWLSPVSYDIRISRSDSMVLVEGSIKLTLQSACSRCLENVILSVNPEFSFCLSPAHSQEFSPEVELQREDLDIAFYSDDAIDISQIIQNQIVLSLPLNPVCKEECKGLCPQCGMNKNHETCECSGEALINPKMAILKDFLKK